jgi:hypothetical protein
VKGAGEPQVAIRPLSGVTSEQARDARANAWAYVFRCWRQEQEGGPAIAAPDDARKDQDARTTSNYSRRQ